MSPSHSPSTSIPCLAADRLDVEGELGPALRVHGVGDAAASILAKDVARAPRGDPSGDERAAVCT